MTACVSLSVAINDCMCMIISYLFFPPFLSLSLVHSCADKSGWESLHLIFLSVCDKCGWVEILHNKQIGPRL